MKKERKPIAEYISSSLSFYIYTVVFSILGLVFLMDTIPPVIVGILGIVFMLPICFMSFHGGMKTGEKEYKKNNTDSLVDVHNAKYTKIEPVKPFLHVIPYVIFTLALSVIAVAFNFVPLHGVMQLVFIPFTLIFKGFGVITIGQITWMSFVMVLLHVVLTAGCFIAGYFLKASALRRRASEIVNEIRSVG